MIPSYEPAQPLVKMVSGTTANKSGGRLGTKRSLRSILQKVSVRDLVPGAGIEPAQPRGLRALATGRESREPCPVAWGSHQGGN
jgi:hypothetical protein